MTQPLRPYQVRALGADTEARAQGANTVCLVAPTGSGKTVMGAAWAGAREGVGVWTAHRQELLDNAREALGPDAARVHFHMIQAGRVPEADWYVCDECFPAGTLVDGRPIETISEGDVIACVDHCTGRMTRRRVARTMTRVAHDLVIVKSGGRRITCTRNHPIFVRGKGYVDAGQIVQGDMLCLRTELQRKDGSEQSQICPQDLLCRVSPQELVGDYGTHEQGTRLGTNALPQSDARPRDPRKGIGDAAEDWTQTQEYRRKWSGADSSGKVGARSDGRWLDNAVHRCHGHEKVKASHTLQDRRGERSDEGRDRSGRQQPLLAGEASAGRAEGHVLVWARVDRVESQESRSCDGVRVYNLEVEGCHTYFANGILVHNCHHLYGTEKWSQAVLPARHRPTLALTATPERADGAPLGNLADAIVVAAQPRELIDQGYLVPCEIIAADKPTRHLSMSPVEAYQTYGDEQRTIVFCRDVKHAKAVADDFNAAGISAACVEGKDKERSRWLEAHRTGELQVLTNVHILTEGYDDPAVSFGIIATGVSSAGAWIQRIGRLVRSAPGKTRAVCVDLRGSVYMWGLPDEDRHYSLTGRAIALGADTSEAIRQCRACFRIFRASEYADATCPGCGVRSKGKPDPRIKREQMQRVLAVHTVEDRRRKYAELVAVGREKGYSPKWPLVQFKIRYHRWPTAEERRAS